MRSTEGRLWVSSREAHRLYAARSGDVDDRRRSRNSWSSIRLAVFGDELRVVIGFGEDDDDRYIYRFVPGQGFADDRIECPDLSGVHLAYDGDALFLSQAHNRRILALDGHGGIIREIPLGREPVGMTIVDGAFYLVTGENFKNLHLTRVDTTGETPLRIAARIDTVRRARARLRRQMLLDGFSQRRRDRRIRDARSLAP